MCLNRTQRHMITVQGFENNWEAKIKKYIKKSEINFALRLNSSSIVSKGLLYLSITQPRGARQHRYLPGCILKLPVSNFWQKVIVDFGERGVGIQRNLLAGNKHGTKPNWTRLTFPCSPDFHSAGSQLARELANLPSDNNNPGSSPASGTIKHMWR